MNKTCDAILSRRMADLALGGHRRRRSFRGQVIIQARTVIDNLVALQKPMRCSRRLRRWIRPLARAPCLRATPSTTLTKQSMATIDGTDTKLSDGGTAGGSFSSRQGATLPCVCLNSLNSPVVLKTQDGKAATGQCCRAE